MADKRQAGADTASGALSPSPRSNLRACSLMVGFACCMGYLLMMATGGMEAAVVVGGHSLDDADLVLFLLGCSGSLCFVAWATPRARDAALSPLVLQAACLLAAVCALGSLPFFGAGVLRAVMALLGGAAGALMLAAWARALQLRSGGSTVRAILVACGLASLACFSGALFGPATTVVCAVLMALATIPCIRLCMADADRAAGSEAAEEALARGSGCAIGIGDVLATKRQRLSTKRLSDKMLGGAALFGVAAGFMYTFDSPSPAGVAPAFVWSFLLLGLFSIAVLQLLSDDSRLVSGRPNPLEAPSRSLLGAYRLALLLMMAGYLFAPVLSGFAVTGSSIVLAGFLGLQFVLAGMFLTVSKVAEHDAALSFSRGFCFLYLGQAAGLAAGTVLQWYAVAGAFPYFVVGCAGLVALFAYLFLFTEGDFGALIAIAAEIDRFDEACQLIASRFELSKRESELLPLALRGRSGERMASELFISKSTVETHLRRIYQKTGTKNRQELIDLGERTQRELALRARP